MEGDVLETSSPISKEKPSKHGNPFTPAKRLAAEHQWKVLAIAIAIVSPLLSLHYTRSAIADLQQPRQVMVLDAAGNIHVGPLENIDKTSELFRLHAIQSTQAFFLRNPQGLTNPELAEKLFTQDALDDLRHDLASEQPLFKRNDFYQVVEVTSVTPKDWINNHLQIVTRGFLTRAGAADGMAIRPKPIFFALSLDFIENPNLGERGQYPFRVSRWAKRWEDGHGKALGAAEAP